MIEQQLYHTVLILASIINLSMAIVLLHGNLAFREYTVYCQARRLVAIWLLIFAIGFLMHAHFQWRYTWPAAATSLSVSYFHCGGVLFSWSHTSLLNPKYLTKKVIWRDLSILIIGVTCYWLEAFGLLRLKSFSFIIFIAHALFITYTFYHTYYRVKHSLLKLSLGTTEQFVRWMLFSCHLIVGFGIGSIVLTACLPVAVWPYIFLLSVGILVFIYIFFSLNDYGAVIDMATNVTEDIEFIASTK
jgi:hypothetical protein